MYIRNTLAMLVRSLGRPRSWIFLGLGYGYFDSVQARGLLPVGDKAVLITGCDTGFGHALAQELSKRGIKVFAGCLDGECDGARELKNGSDKMVVLQLDVTDERQIADAKKRIKEELRGRGLWGIVNNAGVCYLADIELTPEKIFRRTHDVNLMGAMAVTKQFLPLVRECRGRIVNVSSLAGRVPMEGYGAYSSSKAALEAYSDVLRLEMKKWKVNITTVQPAGYITCAVQPETISRRKEQVWESLDTESKEVYGRDYYDKLYDNFKSSVPNYPSDVSPVLDAITAGLLAKRPKRRYQCGTGAGTLVNVLPVLPVWLADPIIRMMGFGVQEVEPMAEGGRQY